MFRQPSGKIVAVSSIMFSCSQATKNIDEIRHTNGPRLRSASAGQMFMVVRACGGTKISQRKIFEPMVGIEPTTYSFACTSTSPPKRQIIRGLDCIFIPTHVGTPLSVVRAAYGGYGLTPPWRGFNRYSGFIPKLLSEWAGVFATHHGVALPLSYIGNVP